ncbi:MAG: tRNA (cytidine(34)-2'-O)-methyltransferase [Burkholderiales bacterium]
MFDVVLFQPEIPPNTGNIIRLCANTGCRLHLVKPLGFHLSDRALKRPGLDYEEMASVTTHRDWETCGAHFAGRRTFAFTTRVARRHAEAAFAPGDVFVFGPETRGLPAALLDALPESNRLRLPMRCESRSLNLSNAVAVVVYEAWRQRGFDGGS